MHDYNSSSHLVKVIVDLVRMESKQISSTFDEEDLNLEAKLKLMIYQPSSWSDLPRDLLYLIASRLTSPLDNPRFAFVCRSWRPIPLPVYTGDGSPLLMTISSRPPTSTPPTSTNCHFYSPSLNRSFTLEPPYNLSTTDELRFANNGWVMFSRGDFEIFFVNPFSNCYVGPIESFHPVLFWVMAFSSVPNSPDCIVFGISGLSHEIRISTMRYKEDWSPITIYQSNRPFRLSRSNPVFYCGLFYCLGERGTLGVFDPEKKTWTILDKPKRVADVFTNDDSFLVESDGELLLVCMKYLSDDYCKRSRKTRNRKQMHVFRLNQTEMVWETMTSLGARTLFVGGPMAFSTTKCFKGMKNKIYIPTFTPSGMPAIQQSYPELTQGVLESIEDQSYVMYYYSLESESYYPTSSLLKSKTCVHSIWIEPNQT